MLHLLVLFVHLLATCIALGAILATDLRLLGKLTHYRVRIAPPNAFVTRLVGLALLVLCLSGAALLWLGLDHRADYLDNPKLQAKLLLVATLAVNALVLHGYTFPRLARGRRVKPWTAGDMAGVAVPVALSNCLWLFCAFLGIARAWNDTIPFADVLAIAAVLFVLTLAGVMLLLTIATRDRPRGRPADWVDALKLRLGHIGQALAEPAAHGAPRRGDPRHLVPKMRSPASPRPGTM